jgi:hypothetical protein
MATIRRSPTEVEVDSVIYTFPFVYIADDFEACVAVVNVKYCERLHLPVSQRLTGSDYQSN